MNRSASLLTFSLVACGVYVLSYIFGWQMFEYYPLVNEIHMTPQPKTSGPAMLYYGWKATALVAGLIAAVIVPARWSVRLPLSLMWWLPLVLSLVVAYHERRWFLG